MLGLYLFLATLAAYAALVVFGAHAHRALWVLPLAPIYIAFVFVVNLLATIVASVVMLQPTILALEEDRFRGLRALVRLP